MQYILNSNNSDFPNFSYSIIAFLYCIIRNSNRFGMLSANP